MSYEREHPRDFSTLTYIPVTECLPKPYEVVWVRFRVVTEGVLRDEYKYFPAKVVNRKKGGTTEPAWQIPLEVSENTKKFSRWKNLKDGYVTHWAGLLVELPKE